MPYCQPAEDHITLLPHTGCLVVGRTGLFSKPTDHAASSREIIRCPPSLGAGVLLQTAWSASETWRWHHMPRSQPMGDDMLFPAPMSWPIVNAMLSTTRRLLMSQYPRGRRVLSESACPAGRPCDQLLGGRVMFPIPRSWRVIAKRMVSPLNTCHIASP